MHHIIYKDDLLQVAILYANRHRVCINFKNSTNKQENHDLSGSPERVVTITIVAFSSLYLLDKTCSLPTLQNNVIYECEKFVTSNWMQSIRIITWVFI